MASNTLVQTGAFLASGGADPAVWLAPSGALCLTDLYAPLITPDCSVLVSPTFLQATGARLDALPPQTLGADFDLEAILADASHPHRQNPRILVTQDPVDIELAAIRDLQRTGTWMRLGLRGAVLEFRHRGRTVEYDLSSFRGRPLTIVARWNPGTVSLEALGIPTHEPTCNVSFGELPTVGLRLRTIVEGQTVDVERDAQDQETAPTLLRGLAIAFLVKRGTTLNAIQPMITALANAAADVLREILERDGLDAPQGLLGIPHFVSLVEVDDERWERWRTALGRSDEWVAEAEFATVRFPLLRHLLASATSAVAYAFAQRIDVLVGDALSPPLVPPVFVDADDARRWFWVHATRSDLINDALALEMKSEIETRVRATYDRAIAESVRLDVTPLQTLFDLAGRDWLRRKSERRSKKLAEPASRADRISRVMRKHSERNTALDAFRAFSADTWLRLVSEQGSRLDLFTRARTLSELLDVVQDRAPTMIEQVKQRLQVIGDEAAKVEFEIVMLALLLSLEHQAEFVPTASHRTPDIVLRRPDGDVYVECAEKDALSADARSIDGFALELTGILDAHASRRRESFHLHLVSDAPFDSALKPDVVAQLKTHLRNGGGDLFAGAGRISGRLRRLGDYGRVWSRSALQEVEPEASQVYVVGSTQDGWSLDGFLMHANVVSVTFQSARRLTTSIEHTLRDKGKSLSQGGQVPDGRPTVCAISLGTLDDATAADVLAAAPRLLAARSAVSALVLLWSKRVTENYVPVAFGWRAAVLRNPRARNPAPQDLVLPDGILMMTGLQRDPP